MLSPDGAFDSDCLLVCVEVRDGAVGVPNGLPHLRNM